MQYLYNIFTSNYKVPSKDFLEKSIGGMFYLLLLLLPFERMMQHDGKGMLLYVVIMLAILSISRFRCFYLARWNASVILYFCCLMLGTISDYMYFIKYGFGAFFWVVCRSWVTFYVLIFAYNIVYREPKVGKKIVGILIFDGCLVALFQVLGIAQVDDRFVGEGMRQATLGENVNASARFISLGLLFVLLVIMRSIRIKVWQCLLLFSVSSVCLLALLRTGSRGGLASLMIAMLASVLTMKKFSKKFILMILACIVVLGVVAYIINDDMFLQRIENTYYKGEVGGRDSFWEESYYLISSSTRAKIVGYGSIAHNFILGESYGLLVRATHNTYMAAYMASGLLGGTCYLLFLLSTTWISYKRRHHEYWNFLFLVMVMMVVGGMVMNIEMMKWFFVICGVISGAYVRERKVA